MNNRTIPFTVTVEEADNLLFKVLAAEFNAMYPNDTRVALKAAMHVCDKVVAEFDAIVAKQAKSAQARAAAQARYAGTAPPATEQAVQAQPTAGNGPTAPFAAPAPAVKRHRRTKAEIAAAKAAAAPQPVGQSFAPPAAPAAYTPPPIPAQPLVASPPPAPVQASAEPPVVSDFAALAQQAAQQGVPQFAPAASPQQFVPTPPPTFG